ncbi:MAG: RNA-binding S4 domain-containing protein [Oscillospiraceae bacterium]|nr:RNA-binding S4 domain-containing protein [Oscillospiraceae bacterium]
MKEVKITTEFIKLDSFLKFCGAAATGGEAKLMIAGGKVFVDAEPCAMRGKKLRPGMTVEIDGGKEAFRVSGS